MHSTVSFPPRILISKRTSTSKLSVSTWPLAVVLAILVMLPQIVCGQANGSFSGNVTDKSGSGIPGATGYAHLAAKWPGSLYSE